MSRRVLCVRLDNAGDVLLAGPAIRAVAAQAEVVLLAGPEGESAARLLPGVSDVLVWRCPWIAQPPDPTTPADIAALVTRLAAENLDAALIFTSFHQSPLPTALVLRMAGMPWIGAISTDYPGSLLDLRHQLSNNLPEPERGAALATAAGFARPAGDDGRLRVRTPLPAVADLVGDDPYVVLHPGTSVPARAWPAEHFRAAAGLLAAAGWQVVLTGSPGERELTRFVASAAAAPDAVPLAVSTETARTTAAALAVCVQTAEAAQPTLGRVRDLGGRTDLAGLAGILAGAAAVVVGNTGPAHLAAAVGTPVVSLFAPTVPAARWRPYGVAHILLGDQNAPCRNTRVTSCPYPGHPCLSSVLPSDVVEAVTHLAGGSSGPAPMPSAPTPHLADQSVPIRTRIAQEVTS